MKNIWEHSKQNKEFLENALDKIRPFDHATEMMMMVDSREAVIIPWNTLKDIVHNLVHEIEQSASHKL